MGPASSGADAMNKYLAKLGFQYFQIFETRRQTVSIARNDLFTSQDEGLQIRIPFNGTLMTVRTSSSSAPEAMRFLRRYSRKPQTRQKLLIGIPTAQVNKSISYGSSPQLDREEECREAIEYFHTEANDRQLRTLSYVDVIELVKIFRDSLGSRIVQRWVTTSARITATHPRTGLILQDHLCSVGDSPLALVDENSVRYGSLLEKLLTAPNPAEPPARLRGTVLLDTQAASALFHEMGHLLEGDNYLDQRLTKGTMVCSDEVCITDSPISDRKSPTYHRFDDEGFSTTTRLLLDHGIVAETIDTTETAVRTGGTPGGCRIPEWRDPVIPRMSRLQVSLDNKVCETGDEKDRVVLVGSRRGSADIESGTIEIEGQFCQAVTHARRMVSYPNPILRLYNRARKRSSIWAVSKAEEVIQSNCTKTGSTVIVECSAPQILLSDCEIVFGG